MLLTLRRTAKKSDYTIGKLYIDGIYFCDTLEDRDRGLKQSMAEKEIAKIKVPSETAIPTGTYSITLKEYSTKFGKQAYYQRVCNGRLPRLQNVKGYSGVLIHAGNTADDSAGCILVGQNKIVGQVINSRATFEKLYAKLRAATNSIIITIR